MYSLKVVFFNNSNSLQLIVYGVCGRLGDNVTNLVEGAPNKESENTSRRQEMRANPVTAKKMK